MPRQERGEARREQILAAAERLFRSQGYTATSMRQIAEEAGFGSAVSGLYNHYPNKEAIFKELIEKRSPYQDMFEASAQVDADSLEEFLRKWIAAIWTSLEPRLDFLQLVFIDFQEFEGQTLVNFVAGMIPRFFEMYSRIVSFPDVRRDLPLPVIVRFLASTMIGFMITEIMLRQIDLGNLPFSPAVGEQWIDGIVSIAVRGLSVEKPTGGESS